MRDVFENLMLRITFTSFVAKIALTCRISVSHLLALNGAKIANRCAMVSNIHSDHRVFLLLQYKSYKETANLVCFKRLCRTNDHQ